MPSVFVTISSSLAASNDAVVSLTTVSCNIQAAYVSTHARFYSPTFEQHQMRLALVWGENRREEALLFADEHLLGARDCVADRAEETQTAGQLVRLVCMGHKHLGWSLVVSSVIMMEQA